MSSAFNREALRELFDYTSLTWAAYGKALRGMPPEDFTRPVDGSGWPALHAALFHIASAWDGWSLEFSHSPEVVSEGYRPENDFDKVGIDPPVKLATWEETDAYRQRMRSLLKDIIETTSDGRVDAAWMPIVPGGEPEMTPADIIAHILLHERGHHGDVSTLFHALGVTLPPIDYMTYVFFRNRKSNG